MSNPLISIILTTYNRCNLLPRAINSVFNGAYDNFELIIIDDASSDKTSELVCHLEDPRIKYVRMTVNGGVLRARNRGFDLATGDYVAILDDDDELVPGALKILFAELQNTHKLGIDILWFDCEDFEIRKKSGLMPRDDGIVRFEDYVCGKITGDFWLVFSKKALQKNRFCEKMRAHESLLWLKIHEDFTARYIPIILCRKFRQHGERLCDLTVRLTQLKETTYALRQYLEQFGDILLSKCPGRYGSRLGYLGLHEMMIGNFSSGRQAVVKSLKYRFSLKYFALFILSWFVGSKQIIALYRYIERVSTDI